MKSISERRMGRLKRGREEEGKENGDGGGGGGTFQMMILARRSAGVVVQVPPHAPGRRLKRSITKSTITHTHTH